MTQMQPLAGFDWHHVEWAAPEAPQPTQCSYCAHPLDEDEMPLILWTEDGHAAHFCTDCQRMWWGLR